MKKIFVVLACVAMLFSFASCDNNSGSSANLNRVAMAAEAMKQLNTAITTAAGSSGDFADAEVKYVDDTHADIVITIKNNASVGSGAPSMNYVEGTVTISLTGDAFGEKDTTSKTTQLKEATISTDLTFTDAVFNQYSFSVNGKVAVNGTLTITKPVAATEKTEAVAGKAAVAGVTKVQFSDTVAISADGGVDTKAVFEKAGITSSEAQAAADQKKAETAAKAFVADLVSKFTEGTKSIAAGAYDDEAKTITVTVSGVDASGLNQNVEVVLSGVEAASEANDDSAYDVTWTSAAVTKLEGITDYETLEFTGVGVTGTLTTSVATLSSTSAFTSTEGLTIAIDSVKLGSYTVDLAADAE